MNATLTKATGISERRADSIFNAIDRWDVLTTEARAWDTDADRAKADRYAANADRLRGLWADRMGYYESMGLDAADFA